MTMLEVTHSLQHLMAQATHDTAWITTTQTLLEDHAKLIDEGSAKAQILNQVGIAMKAEINRAFATVGENDIKIKSVIKDLCAVTQQSVASLDTSFREQVKAEIIDLRTAIDRVCSGGGSVPPGRAVHLQGQPDRGQFVTNQDKTAASLAALQVIAGSAGELAQAVAAKVEHHEGQQRQRQQQQQQQPNMIGSTAGAPAPTGATGVCAAPYADAASDGAYGMSHTSAGGVSPNAFLWRAFDSHRT